jgi:hypothetical protein
MRCHVFPDFLRTHEPLAGVGRLAGARRHVLLPGKGAPSRRLFREFAIELQQELGVRIGLRGGRARREKQESD